MIFQQLKRPKLATEKLNNKKGISLAEMLICVILLSLFSIAAVTGILTAYNMSGKIAGASYQQELADTILNEITGELQNAEGTNAESVVISDGSIQFFKNNALYIIQLKNGKIVINDSSTEKQLLNEKVSKGFTVEDLKFTKKERTDKKNVILVELTLKGSGSAETYSSYVYLRNLSRPEEPIEEEDEEEVLPEDYENVPREYKYPKYPSNEVVKKGDLFFYNGKWYVSNKDFQFGILNYPIPGIYTELVSIRLGQTPLTTKSAAAEFNNLKRGTLFIGDDGKVYCWAMILDRTGKMPTIDSRGWILINEKESELEKLPGLSAVISRKEKE